MKIENQVCLLEQSIRLKELGIPQEEEAQFLWFEVSNGDDEGDFDKEGVEWHPVLTQYSFRLKEHHVVGQIDGDLITSEGEFCGYKPPAQAFTVAELGEMLVIDDDDHFCSGSYSEHLGLWKVDLHRRDEETELGFKLVQQIEGETEAEARADMLIYLIDQKIMTMESINSPIENKGK